MTLYSYDLGFCICINISVHDHVCASVCAQMHVYIVLHTPL